MIDAGRCLLSKRRAGFGPSRRANPRDFRNSLNGTALQPLPQVNRTLAGAGRRATSGDCCRSGPRRLPMGLRLPGRVARDAPRNRGR